LARSIFSWADFISIGANSPAPALAALAIADRETAICSVGAGVLAQAASKATTALPAANAASHFLQEKLFINVLNSAG
jgi:hypothetical protein